MIEIDKFIEAVREMRAEQRAFFRNRRATISQIMKTILHPESIFTTLAVNGETSDGFHTFNELYDFRKLYNAALFNEWAALGLYDVHKSWRHSDGEKCFDGGWFVVVAQLPTGQITNHYEAKDWELFRIPTRDKAAEWDGHSHHDVIARLESFLTSESDSAALKADFYNPPKK